MCRVNRYEMVAEKVQGYNSDVIDKSFNTADNVARFLIDSLDIGKYLQERFLVFLLDSKMKVIGFFEISKGSLNYSPVHPRDVFSPAIHMCAAGIIVAHNHPSSDTAPSQDDIEVTNRLTEAGKLLGIPLIDHVIVGDRCWTSLKSEGYIS